MVKKRVIISFFCVVLALLPSCGKKGPPVPPESKVLSLPLQLGYNKKDEGVLLIVRVPKRKRVEHVLIEIFKAAVEDEGSFCSACDENYNLIYSKRVKPSEKSVTYLDTNVKSSTAYFYKARLRKGKRTGEFSVPLKVTISHP